MSELPVCLVYTKDPGLLQRLRGFLYARCSILTAEEPAYLLLLLRQHPCVLLFADLCGPDCQDLLPLLSRDFPETLIVALGDVRSVTGMSAIQAGIHAVESPDAGRIRIQSLFDQTQKLLQARLENRLLKEELRQPASPTLPGADRITPGLHHFSGALRTFDNVDIMLENIVDGITGCTRISRVGVFSVNTTGHYTFRAGVKCLETSRALCFEPAHPFVQWLEIHAHSISRTTLHHIDSLDERMLLQNTLDATGAEAILPLFGRTRLIGWICLGRLSSGIPFTPRDIEELSHLAEQISVAIENSLLHDRLAVQKNLAETLLQAIPVGIVSVGANGTVHWFNQSAELLLNIAAKDVVNGPVDRLPSLPASLLNRCLEDGTDMRPVQWTDPVSRRPLWIEIRPLRQDGRCIGAMAVLKDRTEEQILREKQSSLERAEFWNELAGAISHEVRNPLVAISTFSQLLPEKYADEEFRTRFRDVTQKEVNRLNSMIDQLDTFANRPTPRFSEVDLRDLLDSAIRQACAKTPSAPRVALDIAPGLPTLHADADLLADAVIRLLENAFTAVTPIKDGRVAVRATRGEIGTGRPAVIIEVRDNGAGIPDLIVEQVFSPFCTTKPTGIGLGLPIVRRTLIDHEGLVHIDSGKTGTVVRLTLPASTP